ncbi:MAG TPA: hypothetical protein GX497_08770 [Bacillus bacterium]|nr:hypothetical protein [Bacillus sp. (in: firmicutes)]
MNISLINCFFTPISYPEEIHKNFDKLSYEELYELLDDPYYDNTKSIIFEIKEIHHNLVIGLDINSNANYSIDGMPYKILSPGFLIHGSIGKFNGEVVWTWMFPENVMPLRSKNYLDSN